MADEKTLFERRLAFGRLGLAPENNHGVKSIITAIPPVDTITASSPQSETVAPIVSALVRLNPV